MSRTIGVVLSGCGVFDGSEIHEAVLTLLAIDRAGAQAMCLAPNIDQAEVVNHLTGKPGAEERRNVLVESARIARGKVRDIAGVSVEELDALVFPGGYGAAKNLCDFASKGADCQVYPDVARLVRAMLDAKKPLGFICIAPALMAKVAQEAGVLVRLTIGTDPGTASTLTKMGAAHLDCPVGDAVVDREHKIVTTPAYMLATRISEAAEGIEKLVRTVLDLC